MKNKQPNTPHSADQKELNFFNDLSNEWWNKDGKFKPLHDFNPPRLEFLKDEIIGHFKLNKNIKNDTKILKDKNILKDIKILDVGCGGGLIAEPLARLGAEITAIDLVENNITVAKAHAKEQGLDINYQCIPMEDLNKSDKYHVILNMDLLEHVANRGDFIQSCGDLLEENGVYLATTLNRTLKSLALGKIMAEYVLRWLAHGTHDWHKFIKPSELQEDFTHAHLKINKLRGISYNPLRKTWGLSDDISINYIISASKI